MAEREPDGETCSIMEHAHCSACGWPVIDACCNGLFKNHEDAAQWDWWAYCSNKGCVNHKGEGVFQNTPAWIALDPPELSESGKKEVAP